MHDYPVVGYRLAAGCLLSCFWLLTLPATAGLVRTPSAANDAQALGYAPQSLGLGIGGNQPNAAMPRQAVNPQAPNLSVLLQQGLAHLYGLGVPLDMALAGKTMMRAWAQGDSLAAAGIALCHASGCYGTPNARSVQLWADRVRRLAPGKAKLLEWQAAQLGVQNSPTPSTAGQTQRLLMEAVALGDPVAMNERALQLISTDQLPQAIDMLEKARLRGSPAAAQNLGKLQQNQSNTDPVGGLDKTKKDLRFANAVAGQDDYNLALKYHRGLGVPVNITQAVSYYQRSAQQGNLAAKHMLELIFSRLTPQGTIDQVWMRQLAPPEGVKSAIYGRTQATVWYQKDSSLLVDWIPVSLLQNNTITGNLSGAAP